MNSIKKNFMYNSIYQILVICIPLITTPYISRILGAEGIGIYSYSYSVAQYYVLFIMLGLNNYGNRTIASLRDDRKKLSVAFGNIYAMQFSLGIVISIIYLIYSCFFAQNTYAALIMGIYVVSACFDINWFLFGMEKFGITVFRNIIIKIVTTILIFLFIKEKSDVYKYCIIMAGSMIISQVVLWPCVKKLVDYYKPTWKGIKIHIKPNLVLFLTVIAVSLFKIMDKIMLGILTDTKQVGFYESSERIISIPIAFITALGTVMLPRITNMITNNDKGSSSLLYKSILLAMFLSSSMGFGIMGVSKIFVPLFYGPGYEICVQLFLILMPSCLFLAFGNVIRTQYLLPKQMDKIYVISAFLGAIINIIINLLLIPKLGAVGAAVGTLFAEATVCIYQAFMIRNCIVIKKYVVKSFPFIISGIIMFVSLYNIEVQSENQVLVLCLMIIIGVFIYFFVLLIQAFIVKFIFKKKLF